MTLLEVSELCEYWEKAPPTHLLLRAYVQYKPPEKPVTLTTESELMSLVQQVKGD